MRLLHFSVVLVVLLAAPVHAETVTLNHEYSPKKFRSLDRKINPDVSVYGLKFGSSEESVRETFGDPQGVILINDTRKALLYGQTHLLVFRNDKLVELRVSKHGIVDFELAKRMDEHPFFDRKTWVLGPGLRSGMAFGEVQKALKKPNEKPNYRYVVEGPSSTTTLQFVSRTRGFPGNAGASSEA